MTTDFREDWPTGETGRYLVTLKPGSSAAKARLFFELTGKEMVSPADSAGRLEYLQDVDLEATYYPNVGIAVVDAPPNRVQTLKSMSGMGKDIQSVEPERYGHVQQTPGTASYADGFYTSWGLQAVRADKSNSTGTGIRIAVLDSGLDLYHPEFAKNLLQRNFVDPVKPCHDVYGHGTHTAGTLCGSRQASSHGRGFGVAPGAGLIVGKVLTDTGWYRDEWLIAGIDWAIGNRAHVISLSLGANYGNGASDAYEAAGRRGLSAGSLIIAAAGNSPTAPLPVFSPANCESIMAVGAVDSHLQVPSFSAIGLYPPGGVVDIVAPGVDVHSTVPSPTGRGYKSGTSMATPHVAGCAALWSAATGATGKALWKQLIDSAKKIGGPANRVGAGLVQAP